MDLQQIEDLRKRRDAAENTKAHLAGAAEQAKTRFREVVSQVREAGYDPRTIGETLTQKEADLNQSAAEFDEQLAAVEEQLSTLSEDT